MVGSRWIPLWFSSSCQRHQNEVRKVVCGQPSVLVSRVMVVSCCRAGLLSYDIVFELLAYFNQETHYVPMQTAFDNYAFIVHRMYLTEVHPQLQVSWFSFGRGGALVFHFGHTMITTANFPL